MAIEFGPGITGVTGAPLPGSSTSRTCGTGQFEIPFGFGGQTLDKIERVLLAAFEVTSVLVLKL